MYVEAGAIVENRVWYITVYFQSSVCKYVAYKPMLVTVPGNLFPETD